MAALSMPFDNTAEGENENDSGTTGGRDAQLVLEEDVSKGEAGTSCAGEQMTGNEQIDTMDSYKHVNVGSSSVETKNGLNGVENKPVEDTVRDLKDKSIEEEKGEIHHEEVDIQVEGVEEDKEVKAGEETGTVAEKKSDLVNVKDTDMVAKERRVEAFKEERLMEDKETEAGRKEKETTEETKREAGEQTGMVAEREKDLVNLMDTDVVEEESKVEALEEAKLVEDKDTEAESKERETSDETEKEAGEEIGTVAVRERELINVKDTNMVAEERKVESLEEAKLMEGEETEAERKERETTEETDETEREAGEEAGMVAEMERDFISEKDTDMMPEEGKALEEIKLIEDKETEVEPKHRETIEETEEKEVEVYEETGTVAKRDLMDEKDRDMLAEEEKVEASDKTRLLEDKEMETVEEAEKETEEEEEEEEEMNGDEDTQMEAGEEQDVETEIEDTEDQKVNAEETEMEEEKSSSNGGKRKRGRGSKSSVKVAQKKTIGEDVCFVCLDGGNLVLCDRRGCPKAYHPICVDRDDAFFQTKGHWNCGWHLCNECEKNNAYYMCYTCPFSLCKGCFKDALIFCIRGNKGLCETCMEIVDQIENNRQGNLETEQDAFNDRSKWEYLFKDYWMEQKAKFSLTTEEVHQVTNPCKGSDANLKLETPGEERPAGNEEATNSKSKKSKKWSKSSAGLKDVPAKPEGSAKKRKGQHVPKLQDKDATQDSDNSSENQDKSVKKRRKGKRVKDSSSVSPMGSMDEKSKMRENIEWASKELLEFVMHMKDGDRSVLSQYDVQELLLEYIKRYKLRDPRNRSHILCDAMLQRLFGKPRVGHFEMLKLLESHFLLKEDADDNQGSVVDTEADQLDVDDNTDFVVDTGKNKGKKLRRRGHEKGLQSNLDDYAAIDTHNISLIFLRRNLMEALMEDMESFAQKVVGSFVRIRISGSNQKQDIYRLVQVLGTTKAAEPYKVGKRIVDVMLEILNLDKKEVLMIDIISNQDFTEDECKRLRQSIKCGFINRLTVGDVLEKAKEYQAVRVADWLETETTRLNHLRDRASEKGRRKELRECVEKLQLLSSPVERHRRMNEIPEVHADPNMDPSHESEDESETDVRVPEYNSPRGSQFSRRIRDSSSSRRGDSGSTDLWSSNAKPANRKWEATRSLSGKGFSSRTVDSTSPGETLNGGPWSPVVDRASPFSNSSEKSRITPDSVRSRQVYYTEGRANLSPHVIPENPRSLPAAPVTSVVEFDVKINEAEKQWHYKDPSGKTQGPFSVVQLRKWSKNGYFPANLRIWRKEQSEDHSILLTEALAGRFQKESSVSTAKPYESPLPQQSYRSQVMQQSLSTNSASPDHLSPAGRRSQANINNSRNWAGAAATSGDSSLYDSSALPSTSSTSTSAPANVGRVRPGSRWSGQPVPVHQLSSTPTAPGHLQVNNGSLPSPTPESNRVSKFSNSPQAIDRSHQESLRSSVHIQQLASQSTASLASTIMQHQVQPTSISGSVAPTYTGQLNSNNVNMVQNSVPAQSWGSSGSYVANSELMNKNTGNMSAMQVQVQQAQQAGYGQWVNTAGNNQTAAPPQPMTPANYPVQNYAAPPPQNQWMPPQQQQQNVASLQLNMQWGANMGMPPENPSMPASTMMPGNPSMGWAQQPQPAQYAAQPQQQQVNAAQMGPPAMQPGNSNMGWPMAGNMNQGWGANPAGGTNQGGPSGGWNWQPPPPPPQPQPQPQAQYGGGGMVGGPAGPRSQTPCPYLKQGWCRKGAACDYRH